MEEWRDGGVEGGILGNMRRAVVRNAGLATITSCPKSAEATKSKPAGPKRPPLFPAIPSHKSKSA